MTMRYFFDTSALQYRYTPGRHSRVVRLAISARANTCYISEFTLVEIGSALGNYCRGNGLSIKDYDRLNKLFWKDVDDGRLHVRSVTQRNLMRARHLLRHGAEINRNITTVDAVIANSALELALEMHERITLCLEDRRLYKLLRDVSAYSSALKFKYIGPPVL